MADGISVMCDALYGRIFRPVRDETVPTYGLFEGSTKCGGCPLIMYAYDLRRAWASPNTGIRLGDSVHSIYSAEYSVLIVEYYNIVKH